MSRRSTTLLVVIAVAVVLAALLWWPRRPGPPGPAGPDQQSVEANNRGVGLMGRFEYSQATDVFEALLRQHPDWLEVKVNLAIARLNRQQEGDSEEAVRLLTAVLEVDPGHVRANYCTGLLRLYLESPDAALSHFQLVAEADPADPYAAYYVGQCLSQRQQYEEALPWYERAQELDPYLRSAAYTLGQCYMRLGRTDEARRMLQDFQQLQRSPRARLVEFKYTRMGRHGEALAIDAVGLSPEPPPSGPLFDARQPLVGSAGTERIEWRSDGGRTPSITACDIDGDGLIDLFLADTLRGASPTRNAVLLGREAGGFELDLDHPLASVAFVNAAIWGDYDNDGLTDVYLCRRGPNQLWRQSSPQRWQDVTESTGTGAGPRDTVDGVFVDADHDGDLDLLLANANGPDALLSNNLDGTFRPLGEAQGITGGDRASRQVVVADLDGDRDVDLMVVHEQPPHEVFLNELTWTYRPAETMQALLESPLAAVVPADADADGQVELYAVDATGAVQRWAPDAQGIWIAAAAGRLDDGEGPAARQLAAADVRGDGTTALIGTTGDGWAVLELAGSAPASRAAGLQLAGWAVVNLDPQRGPSIVGVPRRGPPLIAGPGPGRHRFLALSLTGREDAGQSMRSNASGLGAHLTIRRGSTWTMLTTLRHDAGPGQSLQPLAIGLGGAPRLDYVAIDWSDGVFQSELALDEGQLHRVPETQRQLSSCPVLFAWDGSRYVFVSDILGVGGIGFFLEPGVYAPPRPWERFLLPAGLPRPDGDALSIKIGEPMQEACYLDAARLVAYDLPPGWSMTLDERFAAGPPEPTGEARFYRRLVTAQRAVNDRGEDVTVALADVDDRAAPVGEIDHRFIGRLRDENRITLTFDLPLDEGPGAPMLLADGWIEYPYAQTMFAAWQAGADYRPTTVEARGADGRWRVVLDRFGYPAGMPRQMSVPLEGLPAGTTALRVSSNQEIYWDRLAVAWAEPCPSVVRRPLALRRAEVRESGFARRVPRPQRRPDYDYDRRAPLWDTMHQAGRYTAFGPATELVAAADDALAIIGPGEEIHLEFAAATEPAPSKGWTRRLVLEADGWCKDMDLYTRDGGTVAPLPQAGRSTDARERERLHRAYNSRYGAGR